MAQQLNTESIGYSAQSQWDLIILTFIKIQLIYQLQDEFEKMTYI